MTKPWDERTKCSDCGAVAGLKAGDMQPFYIHDALWNSIADTHDVLCFDCTEKRLKRPITLADLKDTFLTRTMMLGLHIAVQTFSATVYHIELNDTGNKWTPWPLTGEGWREQGGLLITEDLAVAERRLIEHPPRSALLPGKDKLARIVQRDFNGGRCLAVREVCRFVGNRRIAPVNE